jgi:hypothetical protein
MYSLVNEKFTRFQPNIQGKMIIHIPLIFKNKVVIRTIRPYNHSYV